MGKKLRLARLALLDAVLAPHQKRFRDQGLDECAALELILRADLLLQTHPREAMEYLSRHYGGGHEVYQ